MAALQQRKTTQSHITALGLFIMSSAVLITPGLPVVGTNVALPEAFFLLWLLVILMQVARRHLSITSTQKQLLPTIALFPGCLVMAYFASAIRGVVIGAPLLTMSITLLNYCYGFAIFVLVFICVKDIAALERIIKFWALGSLLVGSVSVLAMLGVAPGWAYAPSGRIASTFREVGQANCYLQPFIPLGFALLYNRPVGKWWRWLIISGIGGVTVAAVGTGNRTGLALVIVALVGSAMLPSRRATGSRSWRMPVIILILLMLSGIIFIQYQVLIGNSSIASNPYLSPITRPVKRIKFMIETGSYLGSRAEQFASVGNNLLLSPIIGIGPENSANTLGLAHEIHNTYLGVYIGAGGVGLLSLLAWFALYAYLAYKDPPCSPVGWLKWPLLLSMMLLLAYGMLVFGLRQRPFWFISGLAAAYFALSREAAKCQYSKFRFNY